MCFNYFKSILNKVLNGVKNPVKNNKRKISKKKKVEMDINEIKNKLFSMESQIKQNEKINK